MICDHIDIYNYILMDYTLYRHIVKSCCLCVCSGCSVCERVFVLLLGSTFHEVIVVIFVRNRKKKFKLCGSLQRASARVNDWENYVCMFSCLYVKSLRVLVCVCVYWRVVETYFDFNEACTMRTSETELIESTYIVTPTSTGGPAI